MICFSAVRSAVAIFLTASLTTSAQAQSVEEFYKGKTIRLIVGGASAGGYDVYARYIAPHLGRHIPGNPAIVVSNLPGAGGIVAAQQVSNLLPRDGTVIAAVTRTIPITQLLSDQPVNFDALKMNWLGNLSAETNVIIMWHTSPTKTVDDIFKRESVVGSSGPANDSHVYTLLLNRTLGTKFKLVTGYASGPEMDLAMQRGELEGRVSLTWGSLKIRKDWMDNKLVTIIAQMALKRDPDLPDVPNILDYVKDPRVRPVYEFLFARQEMGRPFVVGPEVPADRLAALRKGFADAANDPKFLAEVQASGGSVEFMGGEELQAFIKRLYDTPPDVLRAAREALAP